MSHHLLINHAFPNLQYNEEGDDAKELVMYLNYRRLYHLAFKIDKINNTLVIIDAANAYFYQDDYKSVLFINHPDIIQLTLERLTN